MLKRTHFQLFSLLFFALFCSSQVFATAGTGYTGYYSDTGTNCTASGCHETGGVSTKYNNSNFTMDIIGATDTVNPGTQYRYRFNGINLQSGVAGVNIYMGLSDANGNIAQYDTDMTVYSSSNQAVHTSARNVGTTTNWDVYFTVTSGKPNNGSFTVQACMNDANNNLAADSGDKIRCTSSVVYYNSDDDSLDGITLRDGNTLAAISLGETFTENDQFYYPTVASTVSSINVRPNEDDPAATHSVQINGTGTEYGLNCDNCWSSDIPLTKGGTTRIDIEVTAEDGDTRTYYVYVYREDDDADLSALSVSSGSLSPSFSSSTTSYTVEVPYATTQYRVRPYLSDSASASQTVEGVSVSSGAWSSYYGLTAGSNFNFDINVTAEDTAITKNYDVSVRRLNNVNTLSSLTGDGNSSSSSALATSGTIDVTVGFDDSTYRFFPVLTDSDASITLSRNGGGAASISNSSWTGYYSLDEGATTTFTLEITPEDATETARTVTVNVYRESNDNTLTSLWGDGISSSATSLGTSTSIDIDVDYLDSSYRFLPTLLDSDASMTIEQDGGGTSSISNASYTGYYSLTAGTPSNFDIVVTPEDTSEPTNTYTINVNRQNNDADLSGLTISSGTLSPVFASGTTSYDVTVAAGVSSVTFTPTASDSDYTSITVDGVAATSGVASSAVALSTGDNSIDIVVTAEDNSYTKTYTVVVRRLSNDADLSALSVTSGTLSPAFSAATTSYTVEMPYGTSSVTVNATVSDVANAGYTVSGDTGLTTGDNAITVEVTAEDGTSKEYDINLRVQNNVSTLSALSISEGTISPTFSTGVASYTVDVAPGTSSVNVSATATDANAGYIVSGDTGLSTGDNVVTISVTAEDSSYSQDYEITVRVLNNDADLSALSISGATLSPTFSSGVTAYTTSVAPGTSSVSVSATANDSNAGYIVTGDTGLTTGDNTVTVSVTAEDGVTTKDYDITVRVLNDDPSLSNLTIGGTTLSPTFSSVVYSYNASVTSGTSSVTVTPTTTDANANVIVTGDTGLTTGDNTVTVSVTAEDGVTTQDYTVTVRVLDDDANLSALSISGVSISPGFSPSTTAYAAEVPFGTASVSVSATTNDVNAVYGVTGDTGLTTGDNTVTVQVTAEDGVTTKDYDITVRVLNNVATLSALSLVEGTLSPSFSAGVYAYTANVPAGTASVNVSAATTDGNAGYGVTGGTGLSTGDNTVTVTVTAEDGTTTQDYDITVRVLSDDADLASLSVTEGAISPSFNAAVTAYDVTVANGTTAVTVNAIANDAGASVSILNDTGLTTGDNVVTARVTAEDGSTKDYDITVRVLSNDADLSALSIAGATLSPSFSAAVTSYTANVAPGTTNVSISATVADTGNAGYSVSGDSGLSLGDNLITVQVTAEDGTTKDYNITVRVLDNDADLSALSIAGASLSPGFSSGTTSYSTTVTSGTASVAVSATTSDANAGYTVSGDTGLVTGDNVVTVQVTAEDGVTTKDYTITVRVLSANADLSALSISEASISPAFSSGTTAYTATVSNLITSATVSATTSDGNAGYTVSGDTGFTVGGGNVVTIQVTAEDGVTTKDYTITITRAQSSDADLSALVLSNGGLSPAFNAGTTSYTASVSNAISSITVTATVNEANASITVDSNAETSGVASSPVALSVGVNAIPVEVTAEDGTTKTYTVNVTRAANGDAELSGLALSSGTLSPTFAQATTSYTASVSYATTSVTVTPTTAVGTSTVTVEGSPVTSGNPSGSIPLVVGPNSIETEVTAQDGITKLTYTVVVTRAGNNDADLSALSVSGYSISPAFSAATASYSITVPTGTASVSVSATTNDGNASYGITGDTGLTTGDNPVVVQVTAEDGSTTKDYTINVRVLNDDADLSGLTIAGASLTPSFSAAVTSYTASVAAGSSSVSVSATTADGNASYGVSGDTGLSTGDNLVTVTATAENGTTTKDYNVTVRVLSDDADLSALAVTGATLSPVFSPSTTTYNVTVPNGTGSVSVPATTNDVNAGYTVSGNTGLVDGDNTVTVQVTAEDGSTKDYTINVRVLSSNADLSALSVTEGTLVPGFDPAITSYDVSVPNGTTAVTVSSTTDDAFANAVVSGDTGLVLGDNAVTVQVTAEDGVTTKDYSLNVRVLANDADLAALSVAEGAVSPVFAAATTAYTLSVAPGTNSVSVSATTNDANASYIVSGDTGLVTGDNTVTVQVTAEDGTTTKDYDITVRVLSDDADLSSLSIAGASLSPVFAANTISYDTNVSSGTTALSVTATANDANASVVVAGDTGLVAGDNILTVEVTAEDGVTVKTYTVTVRVSNSNANLSALSISGATLSPVFDALTTAYTASVPSGTTSVTVSATTQDGNASYIVSGNTGLVTGDNIVSVQVTAEDTVTVQTYNVTVRVLNDDADLSALSIAGATLTPVFDSGTTSYTTSVPSGTASVAVSATTNDANAAAVVAGDTGLVAGNNALTVTVTAENGTTVKVYNVTVRVLAADADLSALSIAGASLSPVFSAATTSYNTSVAAGTTSVAVAATTNDVNANVLVSGDTGLVTGDNVVTATVTAEDGTTVKVYSTTVRVLSNDADLSTLSVTGATLSPVFDAATTNYTVNVPSGTSNVTVNTTLSDANAGVVVAGDSGLAQGANLVTATVTAEDGTIQVYNITVNVANNNADLSALSIAEGVISPVFDSATTAYSVSVASGTTAVNVSATTDDLAASYIVSGDAGLVTGDNTVTVQVTAEDGTTTQDYTITVRVLSDDADLSALSIAEGSITPAFDPATTSYNVSVPAGTAAVTVSSTLSDSNAGVVVAGDTGLVTGDNAVTVTVTAEDGVTVKVYTITVRVLASNAALASLSIAEGSISPAFASGTYAYSVSVASDISSVNVSATTADPNAAYVVSGDSGLVTGDNTVTVTVTAEDGVTVQDYDITVRVLAADADLSALAVTGYSLTPGFNAATTAYDVAVPNNVTSVTVTASTSDPAASYILAGDSGLVVGDNPVTVDVTAEDGSTVKTYTITVNRAASTNADISVLIVDTGTLAPAFDSATTSYAVSVSNSDAAISFTPVVDEPNATVTVDGVVTTSGNSSAPVALAIGSNPITIEVTAQAGNTKAYVVDVTRDASSDATLSDLVPSDGTLAPAFSFSQYLYVVNVGNSVSSVTLTPTVNDVNATVMVDGVPVASGNASQSLTLSVGDNDVNVLVTAQDGVSQQAYTVRFRRAPSADATLSALVSSAGTLSPVFDPATNNYAVSVANTATSITLTPTSNHPAASIQVEGATVSSGAASAAIPLNVGVNNLTVSVTAEDGLTVNDYQLQIDRAASSDSSLSSVSLSAAALAPVFDSATLSYTATVANAVSSITLNAVVSEANATITVNGSPASSGVDTSAINLGVGNNPIVIDVIAQDGVSSSSYTINVDRSPSSDAELSNLTVDNGSLSPVFDSATTAYTVSVANAVTELLITPVSSEANATITVDGVAVSSGAVSQAVSLSVGNNLVEVEVTAEDGTTVVTYSLTIDRAPSSDADLSGLFLSSGVLAPAFDAAATNYTVTVPNNIENISVTAVTSEANATMTVDGVVTNSGDASAQLPLVVGDTVIDVVVTAEDAVTTNTYSITVTREPSTDASLSILSISAGSLSPVFDSATLSYTASVAHSDDSVVVTSSSSNVNASIVVDGVTQTSNNSDPISLLVGANIIDIEVTAEDGTTVQTYSVTIDRAASSDADLVDLQSSEGSVNPVFNSVITDYSLDVANSVNSIDLTATLSDSAASLTINGVAEASGAASAPIALNVGANPVDVVVTAEDAVTVQTYTVTVNRAASDVATLSAINSPVAYAPTFDPAVFAYSASVPGTQSSIDVSAVLTDLAASLEINGVSVTSGVDQTVALSVGTTDIDIVVLAEDGSATNTYTLSIDRPASSDATLSDIVLDSGVLSPVFSSTTFNYSANVENDVIDFVITATATDANATIDLDGSILVSGVASPNYPLTVGMQSFVLDVTAEDGVATNSYVIQVVRAADADSDNDGIPDVVEGSLLGTDTDNDGIADHLDPDSDNDGIPDAIESGASGYDIDGDGIDNSYDVDLTMGVDLNNDGIDDNVMPVDSDGDGIADYLDADSDADGLPDVVEGGALLVDSDGDGIDDFYDADSTLGMDLNNDGVDDMVEAPDSETDGIPDYLDADSDNDSQSDGDEAGVSGTDSDGDGIDDSFDVDQTGGTDANGDGVDDNVEPADANGDGIPDYTSAGTDTDKDGIIDAIERTGDSDGDGLADFLDLDSDNDGIPDSVEGVVDTDGDGIANYLDTDSDNDGLSDSLEGRNNSDYDGIPDYLDTDSDGDGVEDGVDGTADTDMDGTPDYRDASIDEDGDGLPDIVEGTGDYDLDGIPDFLDTDSDNDGVPDAVEGGTRNDTDQDGIADVFDVDQTGGMDANGDGIDDNAVLPDKDMDGVPNIHDLNADNDGILDADEYVASRQDADGDGIPDVLDLDSDNDGIGDNLETAADDDGDGIPNYLDLDSDNDSIPDVLEAGLPDVDQDGMKDLGQAVIFNSASLPDTDGDGSPDVLDLDSDNNGSNDIVEAGNTAQDPDNNGRVDGALLMDADFDGLMDAVDAEPYAFGASADLDGDGVDSYYDADDDNDGIPDSIEGNSDSDGDGIIDRLDTDSDNDGIPDLLEALGVILSGTDADLDGIDDLIDVTFAGGADLDGDGIADIFAAIDTDGDGLIDSLDNDSDNDGLSDSEEGAADTDGDGLFNSQDVDSDGDSIPDSSEGSVDSDADGIPDYLDTDADGDSIPDSIEALLNSDIDALPDYLDLDSDDDGISDLLEGYADLDNDGLENFRDLDSDGDGINDADENADFNNDGVNDRLQNNREVSTAIRGGGGSMTSLALIMLISLLLIRFLNQRFSADKPNLLVVASSGAQHSAKKFSALIMAAVTSLLILVAPNYSRAAESICQAPDQAEFGFSIPGCWFVGIGAGTSFLEPDVDGSTWEVSSDDDALLKLEVGYQLLPQLYLQASYADLGSAELSNVNPMINEKEPVDYTVLSLTGSWVFLWQLPLNTEFYLKGGLASIQNSSGDVDYDEEDSVHINAGLGLQWQFNNHWFGRMEFDSYSDDAQAFSLVLLRSIGS